MESKSKKVALKYLEGFVYCFLLLVSVMLCISGNTYIKMIPIAFISGLIGQIMFGKKAMTSMFSCIIAIVLSQLKTPALLNQNIISTVVITVLSLVGELCGYGLKKLVHLLKLKSSKRREKEKIKNYILCSVTIIIGIVINSIVNGNPISYIRCKNNLKNYLATQYSSGSRFEIFSVRYSLSERAKYTFYTEDVSNNNEIGKFVVFLDDTQIIQDDYKEKVLTSKIQEITKYLKELDLNENIVVSVGIDETEELTLNIFKKVDEITQQNVDDFSKEIVDLVDKARVAKYFEEIKQMKIVLECLQNQKDNLATYIYMDGYNEMKQKNEENAVDYIKRALNIEYIY